MSGPGDRHACAIQCVVDLLLHQRQSRPKGSACVRSQVWGIQRHVPMVRVHVPQQRGLAGLAWSGDNHNRELAAGAADDRPQRARDKCTRRLIHRAIVHLECKIASFPCLELPPRVPRRPGTASAATSSPGLLRPDGTGRRRLRPPRLAPKRHRAAGRPRGADTVNVVGTVASHVSPGRSGCCHRSPANRLKSESVETIVQPCSTAIAACCASATSFPVAFASRHSVSKIDK